MNRLIRASGFIFILWSCASGLHAKPLTITITQGIEAALPIAVVPFSVSGAIPPTEDIAQIISNDLVRTGQFKAFPVKDMLAKPSDPASQRRAGQYRNGSRRDGYVRFRPTDMPPEIRAGPG